MSTKAPISWRPQIWSDLLGWLEDAYPQEGCALIVEDGEGRIKFRACDNVIDRYHELDPEQYPGTSEDFYMIDPREFMAADDRGESVEVIVHSHPDAGHYFSDADVEAALMPRDGEDDPIEPVYPGADYLVVSVSDGSAVGATLYRFQAASGEFAPVQTLDEDELRGVATGTAIQAQPTD